MPVSAAALRMERSRAALRQVLQESQDPSEPIGFTSVKSDSSLKAGMRLLKSDTSARLALQALQLMWKKHPWRIMSQNASQAADLVLTPIARKSPVALVASAAVVGGLLYLARPWRLVTKSALIAGLLAR
jgi:hypothetical protein